MKKIFMSALVILGALAFTACNSGDGGGGGSLSVNPGSLTFTAAGETQNVAVTGTGWTATAIESWITVTAKSTSFDVTVGATTAERTGSITVTDGTTTKTVQILQEGPGGPVVIFDDFESYEDFALDPAGAIGWSYIDGDGSSNYGVGQNDYPNREEPCAIMIFNPSYLGLDDDPDGGIYFSPHSGSKYAAFFSAAEEDLWPNDDWMISPQLSYDGAFKIAFWARAMTLIYEPEIFTVAYSTTGKAAGDFTTTLSGGPVYPGDEWERYEYTVPAGAKYVAIHCTTQDAYALQIDDIAIGQGTLPNTAPAKAPQITNGNMGASVERATIRK